MYPTAYTEFGGKLYFENGLAGKGSAALILEAIPWNSETSVHLQLICIFSSLLFSCSLFPVQ